MRSVRTAFLLLGSATLIASVAVAGFAQDAAAGKAVFTRKCQTCHGADGAGNAGMAKALNVQFKSLGSDEVQKKSDSDIKKIITDGMGKMKPVTGLSDKDMNDVIAHVRTLKK